MTLPDVTFADFHPILPALILMLGGAVLLFAEVFLTPSAHHGPAHVSRAHQPIIALVFTAAAALVSGWLMFQPARAVFLGFAVLDPFSAFLSLTVCVGLGLSVLIAAGFLRHRKAERGEFYALMLFGAAGMSLLGVSNELVVLFINIEVLSVSTYALAAYLRRGPRPAEAAFKYFILGAFSSAVLLYGISLLYGATGTTQLSAMAPQMSAALAKTQGLVYLGLGLLLGGLAFKVAAVPFHMWTPDVYEGAPTPVTALMSAGVKAAAFAALVRVFLALGHNLDSHLLATLFAFLALATMVIGNLLAIPQRNVKRMLAYSSIAHAGYVLLGVASLFVSGGAPTGGVLGATPLATGGLTAALRQDAVRGILFYLLAYTVSAVGAFGVVSALERREEEDRGTAWDLDRFAGLVHRRPWWAVAMTAFMLSLGGIPPLVGFMGKLLIFKSAVDAGLVWLAVVGILASAAGAYYYLRVVVYMFMRPAPETGVLPERHGWTEAALLLSTAAVVVLGIAPGLISSWLSQAGKLFGQ
ncbi:MAG: NADH-quinone oxidoreductase subunit N [Myxococcaceae bacterium]|nr:NADH-quinone oxidoreductase subunit N [Myxococcaceae bacterium]